jgi:hypothetical protein
MRPVLGDAGQGRETNARIPLKAHSHSMSGSSI